MGNHYLLLNMSTCKTYFVKAVEVAEAVFMLGLTFFNVS